MMLLKINKMYFMAILLGLIGFYQSTFLGKIYHEVDSYSTYQHMQKPGWNQPLYLFDSYSGFKINLKELVNKIPDYFISWSLGNEITINSICGQSNDCKNLDKGQTEEFRKIIINKIESNVLYENISPFALYRFALLNLGDRINYEYFKRVYFYSLSTTYSPIPGFFYSTVYEWNKNFSDFEKIAQSLTILIFYSSLLIFHIVLSKHSNFVGIFAPIFVATNITIASYVFHMGSTIWNVIAMILGLSLLVGKNIFYEKKKYCLLAILCWVSYLGIITFIAAIASDVQSKNKFSKNLLISLFILTPLILIFYQPGQGNKFVYGDNFLWMGDFFKLATNSLINYNIYWDVPIYLIIFILGFLCKNSLNDKIKYYSFVYIVFVLLGMLYPTPSRQSMFLVPVLSISVAIFLAHYVNKYVSIGLISIFIIISIRDDINHKVNIREIFDQNIEINPPIVYYKSGEYLDSKFINHGVVYSEKSYYLVSQTHSVESYLEQICGANCKKYKFEPILIKKIDASYLSINTTYDDRMGFNRKNNLFIYKLTKIVD